ncbi:hypothetical protein FBU31_004218, partial [Coemansia sp. 'formosensis']
SLTGFASTSPFSQPPLPQSQSLQPRSPSTMPPSPSSVASVGASTSSRMSMAAAMPTRSPALDRMPAPPQPPSFAPTSSPQPSAALAYATSPTAPARRGSGMPPEKTPVGRSGVFDEVYNADPYYRRHSVDMGVPMTGTSQYSPPRQRFQQTLPPQQHPQPPQLHHHHSLHHYQQPSLHTQKLASSHGFGAPVRYATRSGPGSPHPLSFDQTAGGLSPSRSGSDRGLKRPLANDDDDDEEDVANDFSASPGPYPYDDEDDDDEDGDGRTTPRAGVPTAEKPYACDQCELSFSRQHNLKSHALTHSTERPFSCPICHTPFRRQHDLKRHMKLHTGEKPHTCTNCGRSFARLDALNRHMRAENFHACNQAAKKARTAAMPPDSAHQHQHLEDPRLKSASAAYLEQRRASTTSSQPPGAPPNWSHWTHRPSIAADESMIRRLQERFGNGSGGGSSGPSTAYPAAPSHQQQSYYSTSSPQTNNASLPPPRSLPHAQPTNYASAADPRAYAHAQQNGAPGANGPLPHSYAGAPPPSAPTSTQRSQQQMQPPPQALSRHTHAGTSSAAHYHHQRLQPHSPSMTYSHGYGQGWQGGSGVGAGMTKPLAATGRPAQPNSSHPHLRLPPMELAPPRRHSLAVTSHLERYRSRDATPPPPPSRQQPPPSSTSGDAAGMPVVPSRIYPQPPPPSLALYQLGGSRPQPSASPMAPLPEGRTTSGAVGGPQLPPASFVNYSPSMRPPPSAAQEMPSASAHHQSSKTGTAKTSPSSISDTPSGVGEYPLTTKSAIFPHQSMPPPPAFRSVASVGSEIPVGAPASDSKHRHPLHMQSMAMDSSGPSSRRGSAFANGIIAAAAESPVVAPDNTRRASIIALTNPQSEIDVRLENAELKRRLDEMETKYLKEIERLNKAVRELEIEKSLLKSLVSEQRVESMSVSPPPPAMISDTREN